MNPILDIPPTIRKLIANPEPALPTAVEGEMDLIEFYTDYLARDKAYTIIPQVAPERDQAEVTKTLLAQPEIDHRSISISVTQHDDIVGMIRSRAMSLPSALACVGIEPRIYSRLLHTAKRRAEADPSAPLSRLDRQLMELDSEARQAKATIGGELLGVVIDSAIQNNNTTDAKWALEKVFSKEFGKATVVNHKGKVNVSGKVGMDVTHRVIKMKDLNDDQFALIQRALVIHDAEPVE